jgi:histidinol dehydrogenase
MPSGLNIRRIDARRQNVGEALAVLRRKLSPRGDIVSDAGRKRTIEVFGEPLSPQQVVERICNDVRLHGLDAVLDYSKRIDKAELDAHTIRVRPDELEKAHKAAEPVLLASVRRVRDNILRFQRELLPRDVQIDAPGGGFLRQRFLPLSRVGICVPGGAAAYPSTVLMTAVPAQAAGVKELVVVAPPTEFGAYNTAMLATCHELGISEVYRVGGAQAVAALAYGVEGIAKVDKIVGPGNLFVALAKRFVFGEVDIDSIAGPSEVVVIADEGSPAEFVAADLIAQAEHAPGSAILISWSEKLLNAVEGKLTSQLAWLERGELARQSLEEYSALILVRDADQACAAANEIASEHLHIATHNAEEMLGKIRHAGAVFLGPFSPVALGDYAAGPSHVLPTGGTARWASGLSALDFVRGNSVIAFTDKGLAAVADDIRTLADAEGLTAHRASIDIRLECPKREGEAPAEPCR